MQDWAIEDDADWPVESKRSGLRSAESLLAEAARADSLGEELLQDQREKPVAGTGWPGGTCRRRAIVVEWPSFPVTTTTCSVFSVLCSLPRLWILIVAVEQSARNRLAGKSNSLTVSQSVSQSCFYLRRESRGLRHRQCRSVPPNNACNTRYNNCPFAGSNCSIGFYSIYYTAL